MLSWPKNITIILEIPVLVAPKMLSIVAGHVLSATYAVNLASLTTTTFPHGIIWKNGPVPIFLGYLCIALGIAIAWVTVERNAQIAVTYHQYGTWLLFT
jgi:hypothetical protein